MKQQPILDTEILYGSEAQQKVLKGVNILADIVEVTLGPGGRTVMIHKSYGFSHITKDGVTVARSIHLKDPFENMGVQHLKQVAGRTCEDAGDGTTTSTILARSLFREGSKLIAAGHNPTELKKGFEWATKEVCNLIKGVSREVETFDQIKQIATISSNGDEEIGGIIAEAMEKVGRDGVITVDQGGIETQLHITEGMQFDQGWLSPYFITEPETGKGCLEHCKILVFNGVLRYQRDLFSILEVVAKERRPILIIAEDVVDQALQLLIHNKVKGQIQVIAVKAPGFGDKRTENLVDIAIACGAQVIDPELTAKSEGGFQIELSDLGEADKVIVEQWTTTLVSGKGDKTLVEKRAERIKNELQQTSFMPEIERLNKRLACLVGGIGVIAVGAQTEAEMKEKKDRVDDALSATKAAVEEGFVPGAGMTLFKLAQSLPDPGKRSDDFLAGVRVFQKACEAPCKAILHNAGFDPAEILADIKKNDSFEFGYDAREAKFGDLIDLGIIDPAKVCRSAIQNAVSASGVLLTTNGIVAERTRED